MSESNIRISHHFFLDSHMDRLITVEEALSVHEYLAEHYEQSEDPISPRGVKNKELLESAVFRPFATAGGSDLYSTPMDKAAALFHGVISNHCFHNGNKRAALLLTMCFLDSCGYWIDKCGDEELFEFTRQTAAHEIATDRKDEIKIIKKFLKKNSRKTLSGDRQLSFFELKDCLSNAGYSLVDNGEYFEVINENKAKKVTKILKKGRAGIENYDPAYIRKLRKLLGLTAIHGWDSTRFYRNGQGLTDNIGELLKLRGEVMDWLAKI